MTTPADFRESHTPDFSEVRGQRAAIDATVDAIARGQSVLYMGPPGIGRTMMARRIPSVLPAMTDLEIAWATAEYESLGVLARPSDTIRVRPFRAPHHTISEAAMVGISVRKHAIGCRTMHATLWGRCTCEREIVFRSGEIHLARFGVLLLDDLAEWSKATILLTANALRNMTGAPVLVATSQGCPCGWNGYEPAPGQPRRECACTPEAIGRYRARVEAYADALRLGARIAMGPVTLDTLRKGEPGPSSGALRAMIAARREVVS